MELRTELTDATFAHRLAQMMEKHGGSFAKAIARAFYVADSQNQYILLASFGHLFMSYKRFVEVEFPTSSTEGDN